MKSPFRVSVITDEITQDFGRALEIIAGDFGLDWVELREMWGKNLMALDDKEIAEARRLLGLHHLRVCDIASPLFKVDWPGSPKSAYGPQRRDQFGADFTFKQQEEVLERSLELARVFQCDRVRCFDFWRLKDASPYRAEMDEKLRAAARKAAEKDLILLIENEFDCNTALSTEAVRTLDAVREPNFMLNWDPGNAAMGGEAPYPAGYDRLPKKRIGHVHCKNAKRKPDGSGIEWAPMGHGIIDWTAQFRSLKHDGFRAAVSLETHWHGAGTPEASTRQCWAEMKKDLQDAGALS